MKFDKILVLQQNALGDVVVSTGVLRALREKFPQSRIAFLVSPETADLVRVPFVDEVVPYTKGMPMLPVIRRLWRYDAAICLDFKYRSAVVPFLARIPVRAGIAHKRKLFLTHPVERNPRDMEMYLPVHLADIMYRSIGLSLEGDLTHLCVADATAKDKARVDELFAEVDDSRPMLAIAPFTSTPAKDWPVDSYRKLKAQLDKTMELNYMILGGEKDIQTEFPLGEHVYDMRGRTNLTETAELLRRADYFIGGCSAPLHIATAVGTPTIALYGSTSSSKWAPKHKSILVEHVQPCTPCDRICYGGACHDTYPCMNGITPVQVYDALQKLMERYPVER